MESLRFWDEDDYVYEIFSILREPAREPLSFWRENVITVVILLRVSEQIEDVSINNEYEYEYEYENDFKR